MALFNGVDNGASEWVLKTEDTNSNEVLLENDSVSLLSEMVISSFNLIEFIHGHIFIANENGSECLVGEFLNSSVEETSIGILSTLRFSLMKQWGGNCSLIINKNQFTIFSD